MTFETLAADIGRMTDAKSEQYGDSAQRAEQIMRILYPNGIPLHAYRHQLLMVRTVDKLCRLANQGPDGEDKGGESPWRDIAGYALIGLKQASDK